MEGQKFECCWCTRIVALSSLCVELLSRCHAKPALRFINWILGTTLESIQIQPPHYHIQDDDGDDDDDDDDEELEDPQVAMKEACSTGACKKLSEILASTFHASPSRRPAASPVLCWHALRSFGTECGHGSALIGPSRVLAYYTISNVKCNISFSPSSFLPSFFLLPSFPFLSFLSACNARVEGKSATTETCLEEFQDFVYCVDHCVAKDLFHHLK